METTQIPAHLYLSMLQNGQNGGNLPRFHGNPVQTGYGISDVFKAIARTAHRIIFPNLVRLGRAVVGDALDGSRSLSSSATARTAEALGNIVSGIQSGAGKRKRKRPTKASQAPPRKRQKRTHASKKKKPVAKRSRRRRHPAKKLTASLSKLLKRS